MRPLSDARRARRKGHAQHLADEDAFERLLNNVRAEDLATIIYTSGTTGEPKGVMLTHKILFPMCGRLPTRCRSHQPTKLFPCCRSRTFSSGRFYVFCYAGVSVYYAASFDQVGEHLREVQPTIMTAVPRLFEKVYHRIVKQGTGAGARGANSLWALKVGTRYAELNDKGEAVPPLLDIQQTIAGKLVFSKWRAGVGGHLRYFVSGGAPLSPTLVCFSCSRDSDFAGLRFDGNMCRVGESPE
jgi:long-chain acyl-CoA synthetase